MMKNLKFVKSVAVGILGLTIVSSCAHNGCKSGHSKCASKKKEAHSCSSNGCKSQKKEANSCSSNGCASKK